MRPRPLFARATWIVLSVLLVAGGAPAGEGAPDFELKALRFHDFGLVDRDITKSKAGELYQPVKLSDFGDNKEVALIFTEPEWKPLLEGKRAL